MLTFHFMPVEYKSIRGFSLMALLRDRRSGSKYKDVQHINLEKDHLGNS